MIVELGVGKNKEYKQSIGMDIRPFKDVDIVCDLNNSIPLKDNSVTKIYARHIIEHLNSITDIMSEMWRVLVPNAVVTIEVPHYKHKNAYTDPTHKHLFTDESFDYWDSNTEHGKRGYFDVEFRKLSVQTKTKGIIQKKPTVLVFNLQAIK